MKQFVFQMGNRMDPATAYKLFKQAETLPLDKAQLALLIDAARADWQHVEPAIFGTLLERALSPIERHKLARISHR